MEQNRPVLKMKVPYMLILIAFVTVLSGQTQPIIDTSLKTSVNFFDSSNAIQLRLNIESKGKNVNITTITQSLNDSTVNVTQMIRVGNGPFKIINQRLFLEVHV